MNDRANCSFTHAVRQVFETSIGAGLVSLQGVTPQNLRGVSGRAYILKLGVFRNIAHIRAPYYYSTSFALAA